MEFKQTATAAATATATTMPQMNVVSVVLI